MPRSSFAQTDFTGGEFSPFMYGRVDADRYKTGLTICRNGFPIIQGPWVRRPGTRWAANTKYSDKLARLLAFQFSTEQAYQIEFGDLYNRFYTDHGLILVAPVPTIFNFTTGVTTTFTTAMAHGLSVNDRVYFYDLETTGDLTPGAIPFEIWNNREFIVAAVPTTTTVQLKLIDGSALPTSAGQGAGTTYTGSTGKIAKIYEITSAYGEDDLAGIRTTQSADVLYVFHRSHPPRKLSRTGITAWTWSDIDFLDGPYLPTNSTSTTITPSGTSGSITLTASNPIFASTDVDRLVRFKDDANNWTWMQITAYTSVNTVTATIRGAALSNTNASVSWRLGLYSETTGYPHCGTFHEDRLWLAGAGASIQRTDGSVSGDYENFSPTDADGTVADDHAVGAALNSTDVNAIFWMVSDEKGLLLGTKAAEWVVKASTLDDPITPTSIQARRTTKYGSNDSEALQVGKSALFIHRAKRKVRELTYFYDVGGFQAPDMNILADHITVGGLEEITFQSEPSPTIWGRRADGTLLGCTYQREGDTIRAGWHTHPLGGGYAVGTNFFGETQYAKVESISVMPSPDGLRDELWMINQRKDVNGTTFRSVEFMEKIFNDEDEQKDAYFLDMGQSQVVEGYVDPGDPESMVPPFDVSVAVKMTGLYYLEGMTVNTWLNGVKGPDLVVTYGQIDFSEVFPDGTPPGTPITMSLGFKYTSLGVMLRPEAGSADGGPAIGKKRRVAQASILFYRTMGVQLGNYELDKYDTVDFMTVTDHLGNATMFTGMHHMVIPSENNYEGQIAWKFEDQTPGAILSVTGFLDTSDGN